MVKYQIKKQKEWLLGTKNSLRNKIIKDTFKYFLIYFLIFELGLIFYFFLIGESLDRAFSLIQANIAAGIITFIIIVLSFRKTLRTHINRRFKEIHRDMKEIKKGNFEKRIKMGAYDEFDELAYFTNAVLDEFEKKLNFEKKYALMDPLTLTYNRRALNLSFAKFVSRVNREDEFNLSLFLFDIDHFKKINDTYGHKIGDDVLKELTKTVKKTLRKDDNLYRIGGEEFIILFFKIPKEKEDEIISRIQREITYSIQKKVGQIKEKLTISGGVVRSSDYEIKNEESFEKMIEDADHKLYQAKESGRNKVIK